MQLPVMVGCGGCTACCTVQGIRELGKPYYTRCQHQTDTGCGIYGNHPKSCQDYSCLWNIGYRMADGIAPGDIIERPDKSGVIFGITEMNGQLYIEVNEVFEMKPWDVFDKYEPVIRKMFYTGAGSDEPFAGLCYTPYNVLVGLQYETKPPYTSGLSGKGSAYRRILGITDTYLMYMGTKVFHQDQARKLKSTEYLTSHLANPDEVISWFKYGDITVNDAAGMIYRKLATPSQRVQIASMGVNVSMLLSGDFKPEDKPRVREIFKDWNKKLGFVYLYC
jgi:hypothetical protein